MADLTELERLDQTDKQREITQSEGMCTFELSYAAYFLPKEMMEDAVRHRILILRELGIDHVRWRSVKVIAMPPVTDGRALFPVTRTGEHDESATEQTRRVWVTARGSHRAIGNFVVQARCALFQHPDEERGWEPGAVSLNWMSEDSDDGPNPMDFRFEHGIEDGVFKTTIKYIP